MEIPCSFYRVERLTLRVGVEATPLLQLIMHFPMKAAWSFVDAVLRNNTGPDHVLLGLRPVKNAWELRCFIVTPMTEPFPTMSVISGELDLTTEQLAAVIAQRERPRPYEVCAADPKDETAEPVWKVTVNTVLGGGFDAEVKRRCGLLPDQMGADWHLFHSRDSNDGPPSED